MGYKTNSIPNIRTIKALRGESLTIDLGATQLGVLTAWMKKDPNSSTYRSFTIRENRYLDLSLEKASDFKDVEGNIIDAIEGKWYFDVERILDGDPIEKKKTIFRGTILFQNDITNSSGVEITEPNLGPLFLELLDTPDTYSNPADFVRINNTGDGLIFVAPDFLDQEIANIRDHLTDDQNPHLVTKTQVGLSNVPNIDTTNASNIATGKLANSILNGEALTTIQVVSSELAMLALTTEEGDIVVRSDERLSYMRNSGVTNTISDFTELLSPIITVNGKTGTVVLTTSDISEGTNKYYTEVRVTANVNVAANSAHRILINNPHSVTKTQVGLGNADNTSDLNKPISNATQLVLDGKVDDSQVLTDVPNGALFTDTIYDDTSVVNHLANTDNPHLVTLEQARVAGNTFGGNVSMGNNSLTNTESLGFQGGESMSWNAADRTVNIPSGIGPVLQVGQETWVHVYNATAGTLLGGKVVYPTGSSTGGLSNIDYAIASSHETIQNQVGILTGDIAPGQDGFVTLTGKIKNIDTTGLSVGPVWISATVAGDLTNTEPTFPDYQVLMGLVLDSGLTGSIITDPNPGIDGDFVNIFNGVIRETFDFTVTSDGVTVTGHLNSAGAQPNLTLKFSDGLTTFAPANITLTAGTDTNPQHGFIFIPQATKILTFSTAGWPVAEHIKIADVILRSATATQADGALGNRNWNDHVVSENLQGHISHITQRLRSLPASYDSGIEATATIVEGTPDEVYLSVTGGLVSQLHSQVFPALDSQLGDEIHIVNHDVNPFLGMTDLATIVNDASGNSINNSSLSFVLWGVINKTGEASHLMLNLPSSAYAWTSPDLAVSDALNFSDYTIPLEYRGKGFLIARFTFTVKNGQWVHYDTQDLRGQLGSVNGGGGGAGGVTTFLGLTDTPNSYAGAGGDLLAVAVGENGLEFQTIASSVFGRVGAVVAETNDYTWAQIDKGISSLADIAQKSHSLLVDIGSNTHDQIDTHLGSTLNPHSVTKTQVGLSNVPNIDTTNASNITTGTLPSSVLPPIALTTVQLAASEIAMLALTTEEGDVVVRSDEERSYMRGSGITGTMADFYELQSPTGETVLSVNGQTGTVILTTTNINEGTNLYYTEGRVSLNSDVVANTAKLSAFGDELRSGDIGVTVQAAGTYNTTIGTSTDVSLTGAEVLGGIGLTDGVVTVHGKRTLTLADLGYTGAANANYITNNNQITNGAAYITSSGNTWRGIDDTPVNGQTAESISSNWAYDHAASSTAHPRDTRNSISSHDHSTVYLGITAKAADSQKLDGIGGSQFLRSDATDYKTAGSLIFNDNIELKLGSSGDVEHRWDGINYITDINGGGNWVVRDGNSANATRYTFDVDNGTFVATGDITAFSDGRLKDNIKPIKNALDYVLQLQTVSYNRNDLPDTEKVHIGWIAQDVEKILPELVITQKGEMETKSINYQQATTVVAEAVKEQQEIIENLTDEVDELNEKLMTQQMQIDAQNRMLENLMERMNKIENK